MMAAAKKGPVKKAVGAVTGAAKTVAKAADKKVIKPVAKAVDKKVVKPVAKAVGLSAPKKAPAKKAAPKKK